MKYEAKKLEKSQMEFKITVEPVDYAKFMDAAAVRLSERAAIKGFRPGKAPYATVKEQLGELKILEEALEQIVQTSFFEATQKEKVDTLGMPQITIDKIAPGNELVFTAVVALSPKVVLADLSSLKIDCKKVEIKKEQIDETIENLRKMQRREVAKAGPSTKDDKVVIDMEMFIDKVPMEGGQAKDHQVYMGEDHYIPGLTDQLVDLKKDEDKEFTLKFPKEHYQKNFAGKDVDFKIKVKDVFALNYPDINDDFAKILGQDSVEKLRELLEKNLLHEAEHKEDQKIEVTILEQLIEKSKFEEIPDALINSEKHKMFHELKHDLSQHGITLEQYLKDLKKTEDQIFKDFAEQAEKRAKAALISRQVALDNNIKVEKAELDAEIALIRKTYGDDETVEKNLKDQGVRNMIASTVQNRKVMKFLKEKVGAAVYACEHDHEHQHE